MQSAIFCIMNPKIIRGTTKLKAAKRENKLIRRTNSKILQLPFQRAQFSYLLVVHWYRLCWWRTAAKKAEDPAETEEWLFCCMNRIPVEGGKPKLMSRSNSEKPKFYTQWSAINRERGIEVHKSLQSQQPAVTSVRKRSPACKTRGCQVAWVQ